MTMYYNHLLRTKLQEWKNNLHKSDFDDFGDDFVFFFQKIHEEPILLCIIEEVVQEYPLSQDEIDKWVNQRRYDNVKYENSKHKLSYLIHIYRGFLEGGKNPARYTIFDHRFEENLQAFLGRVITPIVNYLHESLDDVNTLLYLLEKYKLRVEWFIKDALKEKYRNAPNKQYEQVFEDDIRLYLFDQGIDFPFSTPKSASGRADVVSLVNTEDPLVMEIKVIDSDKKYGKERIQSGFTQIVKYANDYHKNVGYLVVFNLDNVEIEIENKESDSKFPNRVMFNGKAYYIIVINLNYDISASKQKDLKKITITLEDLSK